MGAYATAFPGGVPVDAEHAARPRATRGASRCPDAPGSHRPGDGRARRRPASSTCCGPRAATSSRSCPTRRRWRPPSTGCRCACTRTSWSPRRCSPRATTCSSSRWPPATSRRAAAPRPPPSAGSSSARRSPARSGRRAASGGSSPTSPSRVRPEHAGAFRVADQPGPAGGDRAGRARLRGHRDAAHHRRPGAVGRPAPVRRRRRSRCPTGGPVHRRSTPTAQELPDGAFTVATRRGKQFNSMVHAAVDPLTGAGRDAVYIDEADARALGARRRHRRCGCAARPAPSTGASRWCACRPGRCRCTGPRATCSSPAGDAHREPRSKVPDYNAVVTVEVLAPDGRR